MVFVHQIENLLDVLENNSNDAKKKSGVKKIENLVGQLIFGLVRSFTPPCLFQLIHHFLFWKIQSNNWNKIWHLISVCIRKDKIHRELWHSHRSSWNSSPPFHSLHTGRATLSPGQFYFHQIPGLENYLVCLQILFTGVVHLLVHGSKVDLKKVIYLYQVKQINFVL